MLVIMSNDNNKRYLANEVMFYSAFVCLSVCLWTPLREDY